MAVVVTEQGAKVVSAVSEADAMAIVADAAASCYGVSVGSREGYIERVYQKGHLSVFEHVNVVMRLDTDIATYKALTRHRHCSFTIESTRFKSYSDGLEFITIPDIPIEAQESAFAVFSDLHGRWLREYGKEAARSLIPQGQHAVVTMTTNLREWFHIFTLRSGRENSKNMQILMQCIMRCFREIYPFFMRLYSDNAVMVS